VADTGLLDFLTFCCGVSIVMLVLGSLFLLATSSLLLDFLLATSGLGLLLPFTTKGRVFLLLATRGTGLLLLAKLVFMPLAKIVFLLLTSGIGLLAKMDFFLLLLATTGLLLGYLLASSGLGLLLLTARGLDFLLLEPPARLLYKHRTAHTSWHTRQQKPSARSTSTHMLSTFGILACH
jgi:hypothetical protein